MLDHKMGNFRMPYEMTIMPKNYPINQMMRSRNLNQM